MPSTSYYVRRGQKQFGPFDTPQLKKLAAAGKITRDDAISADRSKWTPAGNVKGLFPPAELLVDAKPHAIPTIVKHQPPAVPDPAPPATVYVQAPAPQAPQPAAQPAPVMQQTTNVVVHAQRPGNTCATLAGGLGVVALLLAFVPGLGLLLVVPLASLALLLALFGFILAFGRGGRGLIGSIGGGLLAMIAIPVAMLSTVAGVGAGLEAIDQSIQAQQQSEQAGAVDGAQQPAELEPQP